MLTQFNTKSQAKVIEKISLARDGRHRSKLYTFVAAAAPTPSTLVVGTAATALRQGKAAETTKHEPETRNSAAEPHPGGAGQPTVGHSRDRTAAWQSRQPKYP